MDGFPGNGYLHAGAAGPDSLLVTARGISHGGSTAFFTVLGMTVGRGLFNCLSSQSAS
ncbi:hypothetical protein MES5069_110037 [Mesorhizobium escarrei]|uniref:Uncharacterized protein n=1 Tax=Mesorhizobium escarrei TaxID=666018 RepID=A0ABN8JED9_9HYPH|nr:hypothetical protein MES5069_110037 [Mesorhizobium escarrei]